MGYDVIGDIHGQADKLEALLQHMGYRPHDGAWRHPSRTPTRATRQPTNLRVSRLHRTRAHSLGYL